MKKENIHEERRHFKRLKKEVSLIYMLPLTFIGSKLRGKTIDIGGGGICIKSEKLLEINTILALQLEITLDSGNTEVLRTIGEVVWHKKDEKTGHYVIGIKFILDDEVGVKINYFVESIE